MGFMDKVKDAGKKALFGVMLASVKKYGTVTDGKYKGCQVATDAQGETLLFVMVAKESGRHKIKEDIQSMILKSINKDNKTFRLTLKFKDGEESVILMNSNEQTGSALPTAEQRVAAHYEHIASFLKFLVDKVEFSEETKDVVNLIMRYTNNKEIA